MGKKMPTIRARNALVLAVLAVSSANAIASDWRPFATFEGRHGDVDVSWIGTGTGISGKAWTKYTSGKPGGSMGTAPDGSKYASARVLHAWNCADRTLGMERYAFYADSEGSGAPVYSSKIDPVTMDQVVPDSIGDEFVSVMCMPKNERPRALQKQEEIRRAVKLNQLPSKAKDYTTTTDAMFLRFSQDAMLYLQVSTQSLTQCQNFKNAITMKNGATSECSASDGAGLLTYTAVVKAKAINQEFKIDAASYQDCLSAVKEAPQIVGAVEVISRCKGNGV
jgi:hypothetical protein